MIQANDIPTIADLAFRYGTIDRTDLDLANEIYSENRGKVSYGRILVNRRIATEYQVGLLKLIQDYYIIRKKGEQFGKIAVEKGFATRSDIEKALEFQKKEFKRAKLKKRIGDILVENGTITTGQRDEIVAEQKEMERRAEHIVRNGEDQKENWNKTIEAESRNRQSVFENEYLLILKEDIAFVERVKEKRLATASELSAAEKKQRREYETKKPVSRIGDILVKWEIITEDQKQSILETIQSIKGEKEDPSKTPLEIEVCETGMTARVHIDQKNGRTVELQDIKDLLVENGVGYGVLSDEVIRCFLDTGLPSFPVAGGDFPVEETGMVVLYHFGTEKGSRTSEKVKKGEALAELKLAEKNILGKDVRGNIVENVSSFSSRPLLRPAAGAVFSENREKVFAGKTGIPVLTVEKRIYVHPGINILEDADMRTGPIEEWADITVKGILSDAFPVKAGSVAAGEIRGTELTATGNVAVEIGITGARIKTQGNISARYLRNCTIETFGDVTVDSEIIDSTIRIGGKLKASKARILASRVSAKNGIDAGAVGSDVTDPCELMAGRDDLVIEKSQRIDERMEKAKQDLKVLKEEYEEKKKQADAVFQKMKELKRFHDSCEKKKKQIEKSHAGPSEMNHKSDRIRKDLEAKLASIIHSLKIMNQEKKGIEIEKERLENRIEKIEPSVEKTVADLERDRLSLFKWARNTPGNQEIRIRGSVKQDTTFRGIYSNAIADKEYGSLLVKESAEKSLIKKAASLEFRQVGVPAEGLDTESG